MKTAINKTTTKELIKLIAESSRYHQYEVEDIVKHLVGHMQEILARGEEVKLEGIGTFKTVKYLLSTRPKFIGNPTEKMYNSVKLSVRIDQSMKRNLEEIKYAE